MGHLEDVVPVNVQAARPAELEPLSKWNCRSGRKIWIRLFWRSPAASET